MGNSRAKKLYFLRNFLQPPLAWVSKGPIQGLAVLPEGLMWMIQLGKCRWLEAVTGLLSPGPPHEQHCWESGDTHVTRVGREQIAEKMETSLPVSEITAQRELLLPPPVWERGEHSCGKHKGVTSQPHTSQQEDLGQSFYILNFSRAMRLSPLGRMCPGFPGIIAHPPWKEQLWPSTTQTSAYKAVINFY